MNSLKEKFGKFAVSSETGRNVRGGNMPIDPWGDDGGGGSGDWNICCNYSDGHKHNEICGYSSLNEADRVCSKYKSAGCHSCYIK